MDTGFIRRGRPAVNLAAEGEAACYSPRDPVPGKTILVIDDERDIHRLLKAVLEREGYTIFSALDAMQGSMMPRQVKPSLIILDINLPGGGGPKVYERLRMMSGSAATPILIYSAVSLGEIQKQIPEDPATAILSKPAQPEQILSAVQQLLDRA